MTFNLIGESLRSSGTVARCLAKRNALIVPQLYISDMLSKTSSSTEPKQVIRLADDELETAETAGDFLQLAGQGDFLISLSPSSYSTLHDSRRSSNFSTSIRAVQCISD